MFSLNRAQIVGNVTRDPELRTTPNGQAVTNFGVATNRRWRDQEGNNQEKTEFHNVVAWRKAAEIIAQYVKKGNKIYIEGRMETRQWEGQDGNQRNRTEIVVDDFILLTPKGASSTAAPGADDVPGPDLGPDVEEIKTDSKTEKKSDKKEAKEKSADMPDDEINLDEIPF